MSFSIRKTAAVFACLLLVLAMCAACGKAKVSQEEAQRIVEEKYVSGNPDIAYNVHFIEIEKLESGEYYRFMIAVVQTGETQRSSWAGPIFVSLKNGELLDHGAGWLLEASY